jgi:putative ABC transport system permease protein
MVVGQGARVVALGITIGIGVALASTRALGSLLFGVAPLDLPTFIAMAASMIGVGLLASYIPARRASSVDPLGNRSGASEGNYRDASPNSCTAEFGGASL